MNYYTPKVLKYFHSFLTFTFGAKRLFKVLWYRWLANGADLADIQEVMDRIGRRYHRWGGAWRGMALKYVELAQKAEGAGDRTGAGKLYLKASLYFHLAQWGIFGKEEERRELYHQCISWFEKGTRLLPLTIEKTTIHHDGQDYHGYLYLGGHSPSPAILLIHGADSTKEELFYFGQEALENGFQLLIIDGPGQGESLLDRGLFMVSNSEAVYQKALDFLSNHPAVDVTRIAALGISFGGLWSVKLAALDHRIKACVALGGPYSPAESIRKAVPPIWNIRHHLGFLLRQNLKQLHFTIIITVTVLLRMPSIFGIQKRAELTERVAGFTLRGWEDQVAARTWIINGGKDIMCRPAELQTLYRNLKCPKKISIFEDLDHCCSPIVKTILRREVLWWFKDALSPTATDESCGVRR